MKVAICSVIMVLIGSLLVFRLWQDHLALKGTFAQLEQVRSDLAESRDAERAREAEVRLFKAQVSRLEGDLAQARSTLASLNSEPTQTPLSSARAPEVWPLGLTTNDVDLTSMQIRGTNNIGVLFIPLSGWALENVRQFSDKRQPLIFGKVISRWFYGVWGDGGTNIGLSLKFHSRAEAEAVAAEIRAEGAQ